MSQKNLLNEAQVRQFMKLARLEPLTPGFVQGLTEKAAFKKGEETKAGGKVDEAYVTEADEADDDELEEVRTGVNPVPNLQSARRGHGRGRGGEDRLEEVAPPEELEDYAADDLEDDTLEGDEEAATDELEAADELGDDLGGDLGGGERMVSVDDFLAALETTLEDFLDDEVEIDASELDDEEEVEVDAELDVGGGEEELEMDMGAEEELEEAKNYKKLALGKKGSYDPDPAAGEKEWKGSAPGKRPSRPRVRGKDIKGAGHIGIGGVTKEGQDVDNLVEQVTKRVAARILKTALRSTK